MPKHLVHRSDEGEGHVLPHFVGHVAQVFLIAGGENHFAQPRAIRGQRFFLHAAYLQHLAAKRHFTRHGDIAPYGATAEHRGDGQRDRSPGARPILGDGAGGEVDMEIAFLEVLGAHA